MACVLSNVATLGIAVAQMLDMQGCPQQLLIKPNITKEDILNAITELALVTIEPKNDNRIVCLAFINIKIPIDIVEITHTFISNAENSVLKLTIWLPNCPEAKLWATSSSSSRIKVIENPEFNEAVDPCPPEPHFIKNPARCLLVFKGINLPAVARFVRLLNALGSNIDTLISNHSCNKTVETIQNFDDDCVLGSQSHQKKITFLIGCSVFNLITNQNEFYCPDVKATIELPPMKNRIVIKVFCEENTTLTAKEFTDGFFIQLIENVFIPNYQKSSSEARYIWSSFFGWPVDNVSVQLECLLRLFTTIQSPMTYQCVQLLEKTHLIQDMLISKTCKNMNELVQWAMYRNYIDVVQYLIRRGFIWNEKFVMDLFHSSPKTNTSCHHHLWNECSLFKRRRLTEYRLSLTNTSFITNEKILLLKDYQLEPKQDHSQSEINDDKEIELLTQACNSLNPTYMEFNNFAWIYANQGLRIRRSTVDREILMRIAMTKFISAINAGSMVAINNYSVCLVQQYRDNTIKRIALRAFNYLLDYVALPGKFRQMIIDNMIYVCSVL